MPTVPDAPERVKAVISGENAVVISWLPPRRPNGLLTQYTVYIRVLDQGQEVKITKSILPAQSLHHEATGLKSHETYESWVTASTKVGQGSSTPVIKLEPSTKGESRAPSEIPSFRVIAPPSPPLPLPPPSPAVVSNFIAPAGRYTREASRSKLYFKSCRARRNLHDTLIDNKRARICMTRRYNVARETCAYITGEFLQLSSSCHNIVRRAHRGPVAGGR